jgi:hypothetical protein
MAGSPRHSETVLEGLGLTRSSESPDQAWRRLLRGGFAFGTAPFAAHPLDAERAREMYFMALRAGASRQQVLDEAESYLNGEIPSNPREVRRLVKSVDRFMRGLDRASHKKAAWVVFWTGPNTPLDAESIVAILDPRKSQEKVLDFVEQTYVAASCSLTEKMRLSTSRKDNPYPAQTNLDKDHRLVSITCGHNPWLEARFVRNLRIQRGPDGKELLTWD